MQEKRKHLRELRLATKGHLGCIARFASRDVYITLSLTCDFAARRRSTSAPADLAEQISLALHSEARSDRSSCFKLLCCRAVQISVK